MICITAVAVGRNAATPSDFSAFAAVKNQDTLFTAAGV